jgi:hypothetical protein
MTVRKNDTLDNLAATEGPEDFDALLQASSLGAPHVRAQTCRSRRPRSAGCAQPPPAPPFSPRLRRAAPPTTDTAAMAGSRHLPARMSRQCPRWSPQEPEAARHRRLSPSISMRGSASFPKRHLAISESPCTWLGRSPDISLIPAGMTEPVRGRNSGLRDMKQAASWNSSLEVSGNPGRLEDSIPTHCRTVLNAILVEPPADPARALRELRNGAMTPVSN